MSQGPGFKTRTASDQRQTSKQGPGARSSPNIASFVGQQLWQCRSKPHPARATKLPTTEWVQNESTRQGSGCPFLFLSCTMNHPKGMPWGLSQRDTHDRHNHMYILTDSQLRSIHTGSGTHVVQLTGVLRHQCAGSRFTRVQTPHVRNIVRGSWDARNLTRGISDAGPCHCWPDPRPP
jgi:hypothetical protein